MRKYAALFTAVLLIAFTSGATGRDAQTVWSGLLVASNSLPPEPTPGEISQIEGTLRQLFGYSRFQLIGEARKTLKSGDEDWLATSKYFALRVDARGEKAG